MWLIGSSELSRHGSNTGPILDDLFLLSSHFDEESSVEDFLIVVISDEVDSVNFHFEDDFEWSGIVILDFDELEFGEGLFNIFFGGIEIAFDQVECDVFDILIKIFDELD